MSRRWQVGLPLLLAAAVRVVYGWTYWHTIPTARAPVVDPEVYVTLARRLRAGEWLAPDLLYHSFLYPFFLALFPLSGEPLYAAVIAVQLALGVVATGCAMGVAARLAPAPGRVPATAVAYTLAVPLLFYETKLYPESLAVALLAVLLWQMAAGQRPWAVGLTAGLLALVRSEAVLLAPLVVLWAWREDGGRRVLRRAVAAALPIALCLGAASARNSAIAGVFVAAPTTVSGVTFHLCNNPGTEGGYGWTAGFDRTILTQYRQAHQLAERALGRRLDPVAVERYWWRQGLGYLAGDPARALGLCWYRLRAYVGLREMSLDLAFYSERERIPMLRLLVLPFPVLLVLGALGLAWERRAAARRRLATYVAASVLPSFVTGLAFCAVGRYRAMALVPAVLLAPAGARALWAWGRASRTGGVLAAGVAAALLALVVASQLQRDAPKDRALYDYNLGIAHQRLGEDARAHERFTRAFAAAPGNPLVRNNYARSLVRTGDPDAAEAVLREGLALEPGSAALLVQLGWLVDQRGRPEEAERLFREALAAAPDDPSAKLHAAIALRRHTGDPAALREAARLLEELAATDDPQYARHALLNLGQVRALLGESAVIDPPFERARALAPLTSDEEHDWGLALYTARRDGDARDHLRHAVALDPESAPAHYLLGLVEQRLGNTAAAAEHLTRARALAGR